MMTQLPRADVKVVEEQLPLNKATVCYSRIFLRYTSTPPGCTDRGSSIAENFSSGVWPLKVSTVDK